MVMSLCRHSIDIRSVTDEHFGSRVSLWMTTGFHQWRQTRAISVIRICSEAKQHLQELDVQGTYEVEFGSQEVAGVWIRATFQEEFRTLRVSVLYGKPERFICDRESGRISKPSVLSFYFLWQRTSHSARLTHRDTNLIVSLDVSEAHAGPML